MKDKMRKMKGNNNKEKGEGHKARFAVVGTFTTVIDGEKSEFNLNWDVTLSMENLDYAVRDIAGSIAQVAGKIAKDGIKGDDGVRQKVAVS
jgi:hypothetical protein